MLRKLEKKDAPLMIEWMHDQDVNCNFRADFAHMTLEQSQNFVEHSFDEESQNFAFVDENDEYMGTISLKHISETDKNAEYAVVTRKCAQGTGRVFSRTIPISQASLIKQSEDLTTPDRNISTQKTGSLILMFQIIQIFK